MLTGNIRSREINEINGTKVKVNADDLLEAVFNFIKRSTEHKFNPDDTDNVLNEPCTT